MLSILHSRKHTLLITDPGTAISLNPRHTSWRRNSMRKTCPIPLPDEPFSKTLPRHHTARQPHFDIDTLAPATRNAAQPQHSPSSSSSTTLFVDDDTSYDGFTDTTSSQLSDTLPLVDAMETADTSPQVPMSQFRSTINKSSNVDPDRCTINLVQDSNPHHLRVVQQQRSLGDEYLNVLTQQLSDTDQINSSLIDNSHLNFTNNDESIQQNRPRQMGRRAEGRVRVVSITAETNALGNQVYSNTRINNF